jgi:ribosomal protein L19
LLAQLEREEWEKGMKQNEEKEIPVFEVGDTIEVKVRRTRDCVSYL